MSSSSCAWCGWVPTEQKTSGKRSAIASTSACRLHPRRDRDHAADAGRLRARRPRRRARRRSRENRDGSGCRPACSQACALASRLDIAREHRRRRRQRRARRQAACAPPSAAKSRSSAGTASRSSSFAADVRHERLRQDRDLPDHLGGDVEHRALPRRIGLGERPRRLAGEIAVGVRHHRPDRVEHLVQLLRLHRLARLADHGVGRGEDRLVVRR